MDLTDEQWDHIEPLFLPIKCREGGPGVTSQIPVRGLEWHSFGLAYRSAMAGLPRPLSSISNLFPLFSTMD